MNDLAIKNKAKLQKTMSFCQYAMFGTIYEVLKARFYIKKIYLCSLNEKKIKKDVKFL